MREGSINCTKPLSGPHLMSKLLIYGPEYIIQLLFIHSHCYAHVDLIR